MATERVVLVDGNNLIYRAFYAIPGSFTTASGLHTNAIFGFALMFRKLFDGKMPERMAVIFDAPGKTFRDEKFADYKAQRPKMPPVLAEQLPWIHRVVEAHDVPLLQVPGYEADDVIGTLAREAVEAGHEVRIFSSDKDFAQLITEDGKVRMVDTMRDVTYDAELARKKWGVPPAQMIDYLALLGDKVDNVPGVPGVGQKTAATLLDRFGTLEAVLDGVDELKGKQRQNLIDFREQALLSKELVTIEQYAPLPLNLEDIAIEPPDRTKVNALFQELEFFSLLSEADQAAAIDSDDYFLLTDPEELAALLERRADTPTAFVAFSEPPADAFGDVVGFAIAEGDGVAHYIPVLGPDQAMGEQAFELLKPWLENPDAPKVFHDLRDAWTLFMRHDINIRGCVFETQTASFSIDPTGLIPHNLGQVVKEYLHRTIRPQKTVTGSGQKRIGLNEVPYEDLKPWACHIVAAVDDLHAPLATRLEEEGHTERMHELTIPMAYVLGQMQLTGIRIDPDELVVLEKDFAAKKKELQGVIHELAGQTFNIGSTKQLSKVLFEDLGLPVIKRTKTGYSTNVEVMERLADKHPIAKEILEWRKYTKLINTYTKVLREARRPDTERVHATFQQTTGASGRLITTNPDLQRTPVRGEDGKRIRKAFIPEDGWVMISADWSQIELRVLAHFSEDDILLEVFRAGDVDLHRRTASLLFDVAEDDVTPEQRNMGKTVNFATIYGQGATALGRQLGIKRNDAKGLIERYFETYSGVAEWRDEVVHDAEARGWVETLLGRRRYVPELSSNNPADFSYGQRIAANTPIQGSAADLCKITMMQIDGQLRDQGMRTRMLLQIHDELVFEAPPEELDAAIDLIRDRMEHAYELRVPLKVDIGTGANWAEAH